MSVKLLNDNLKYNSFQRLYYIYGDEEYLKQYYYCQIKEKAVADFAEFNVIEFVGKNFDIEDFDNSVNGYPMMSDLKVVGVIDFDNSLLKKDFTKRLGEVLCRIPPFCTVVFLDTDLKQGISNTALAKMITAAGGLNVLVDRPSVSSLATWSKKHFKSFGKDISDGDLKYMLEIADTDMLLLKNEIEKLCNGTKGKTVTKSDIDRLITRSIDANRFDIIDAFCNGNTDKLLSIIEKLYAQGTDDIVIANVFYWTFSDLWHARLALEHKKNQTDLVSDFSMRSFAAAKSLRYASNMSLPFLHNAMMLALKLDTQLKSTPYNKRDLIITFICDVISRGHLYGKA